MVLQNAFENLAVSSKQDQANTLLDSLLIELGQKLEAGQAVALDAATLAALESIVVSGTVTLDAATLAALETINAVVSGTVAVSNFPASQPVTGPLTDTQLRATPVPVAGTVTVANPTANPETGLAKEITLGSILTELGQKLEPGQAVALDAATLAALESITVTVANPTANPETGLAKEITLGSILTELGQKLEPGQAIALDAGTVAALETVSVQNFPTDFPWASTDRAITQDIRRGLTDFETRFAYDANGRVTRIGKAPNGTAVTAATWVVQTFDYGTRTDSKPVRISVTTEAWSA